MLQPELEELLEKRQIAVGDTVWITDYRHNEIQEKPIRHVPPTKVKIFDSSSLPINKRLYYTQYYFRAVGAKGNLLAAIIPAYDNTGYRGRAGGSVKIFLTEEEARSSYKQQCEVVKEQIMEAKNLWEQKFNEMLSEVDDKIRIN
jgi:hypothetical protein